MSHAALVLSVALAATCASQATDMTVLRVTVPAATGATPVLMLENVEIGAGEGMTIEVLGPPDPETKERAILAVSGLVGATQKELAEPRERMTLAIPLNEKGARLLEGKAEVTLTLRLRDSPGREKLKVGRAYLK